MNNVTEKNLASPHTHTTRTVTEVMFQVCLALLPGIIVSTWFFGIGILFNILLAVIFALGIEAITLKLRGLPVNTLRDGSAIVTGVLFALCLSPLTVWWVTLIGIAFAIIVAKQLFGGLGNNPFNPAMAGYVFVLLCFPVQMAYWPDLLNESDKLSFADSIALILQGLPEPLDGLTGATALSNMQLELNRMTMVSEIKQGPLYGSLGGKAWQWIALSYLLGGIWLLINRIIRWQIPVAVIGSVFLLGFLFHMLDPDGYPSTLFHVFTGGTMLCAFFIATDPASSSTTPTGKLIYGAGIGLGIYVIRTWGSYPDGVAFSVLIMNAIVPLIDYYTRPKAMGE